MTKHIFAILVVFATCNLGPARAQTRLRRSTAICSGWPRFSAPLHYLRGICGTNEGPKMAQ